MNDHLASVVLPRPNVRMLDEVRVRLIPPVQHVGMGNYTYCFQVVVGGPAGRKASHANG